MSNPPQIAIHTVQPGLTPANALEAFLAAFSPDRLDRELMRRHFDSLSLRWPGLAATDRAPCEIEEVRDLHRLVHQVWPHGFFFFNIAAGDLRTHVYCQLNRLSIRRGAGSAVPTIVTDRNELFQLIGSKLESLERDCQSAGLPNAAFRSRARQILAEFGFLKV